MHWMKGWFTVGAVAYGTVVGCMVMFQRNMVYLPDPTTPAPERWGLDDMVPVMVATADGLRLTGWHRSPTVVGRPTVVLFHGNAGHIGMRGFKVRWYLDAGYGVLLAGYRGYAGNPGSPSEDGLYADARAALDFLAIQGVEGAKLVLYGESLGTGVAVQMATERSVGAVVLESPYTSLPAVGARHFPFAPVHSLMWDRFDSLSKIAGIKAPLLVVHGERDGTVPIDIARTLFKAAVEPKRAVYLAEANHNDLYRYGAAEAVLDFLGKL